MPVNIDLPPYTLEEVLATDTHFIHYSASDLNDSEYTITEFFPSFMLTRTPNGIVKPVQRFTGEYIPLLERFVDLSDRLQRLKEASITPLANVIEYNGTAYAVRAVNTNQPLREYLADEPLLQQEAYAFIRPLITGLAVAERNGLLFTFTIDDLYVNDEGRLVLDCMFAWEVTYENTIMDLTLLYFWLLTGMEYSEAQAAPSELDAVFAPRMEAMMMEILHNEALFGSIDDYFKKLKFLFEAEMRKANKANREPGAFTSSLLKTTTIVLAVITLGATFFLLFLKVALPVYNAAHPDLSDPSLFVSPSAAPTIAAPLRNYTSFAFCDPSDFNNMLNGAFYNHNGTLYYRIYDNGYALAKRTPDGEETILLREVRPTFITVYDGYVYFCDGLSNYQICRISVDGKNTEVLTQHGASFLRIDGHILYYTNHSDRDRLYQLNLLTDEDQPFVKTSAYGLQIRNGIFYFINGQDRYNLYAAEPASGGAELTRLANGSHDNLVLQGDTLFHIEVKNGQIAAMTTDGDDLALDCPVTAYAFAADGDWLVIIEARTRRLFAYHSASDTLVSLSEERFAYVYATGGTVYALTYNDVRTVRQFTLRDPDSEIAP